MKDDCSSINYDVDFQEPLIFVTGLGLSALGTFLLVMSVFQSPEIVSRMWMSFGIGVYFLGISVIINASFSQGKAFYILRQEIRALSHSDKIPTLAKQEIIEEKKDLSKIDDSTRRNKIDKIALELNARILYYTSEGVILALAMLVLGSPLYPDIVKGSILIIIGIVAIILLYNFSSQKKAIQSLFEGN